MIGTSNHSINPRNAAYTRKIMILIIFSRLNLPLPVHKILSIANVNIRITE